MITIDGSEGEGGGQVLRTALGLSLLTGKAFKIYNIRAGRKKPGLMRQHQTAVKAAIEISGASAHGDALGSQALEFTPKSVKAGNYCFSVGTAGSCILVLQAILPPLLVADKPSCLTLEGGTHNPYAPPFEFLADSFLPILARMGANVSVQLERAGFYPAGGGRLTVMIEPVKRWVVPDIMERGNIHAQKGRILLSSLPHHIGERELKTVKAKLGWNPSCLSIEGVDSRGPGNMVVLSVQSDALTETFTGCGQKGVKAERVASRTCKQLRRYISSEACVGVYLADQLLIPMAMAGGGRFTTLKVSQHFLTNAQIIKRFLEINIEIIRLKEPGPNQSEPNHSEPNLSIWEIRIGRKP